MEELTDAKLLTTWRAGDQEAFGVLAARYHGLVHAACARQAAPGDIDDCVQAVFLVLARRPAAAARVPVLAAWLQRVASFVCRRSRRGAERRQRAESAAAIDIVAGTGSRPVEALGHLDECLLRLPDKQRTAVVMHYLAGRSPEEVAVSLGTSRDNAYQLLSRGLAGLRALLARRGVAVSVTALTGLLASEAQAAVVPATSTVVAALATPAVTATTLATGAITAMTIATVTPFALAAGLILAVATTTVAVTAETAPVTQPVTAETAPVTQPVVVAPAKVSPPAVVAKAASADWDALQLDPQLQKEITLDFQDTDMEDVLAFMRKVTDGKIFGDAMATVPLTLRCERMRLADVLTWSAILSDARIVVRQDVIQLVPAGPTPAEPPMTDAPDHRLNTSIRARLTQQRLTFDFQDQTAADIVQFLRQVSGASIMVHPRCHLGDQHVTLKVTEAVASDAFAQIFQQLKGCRMVIRNGAIGILPMDMAPAPPEPVAPTATF